jgi:peptide/nickel transport system permease protein
METPMVKDSADREQTTEAELRTAQVYTASQWQLILMRFHKHRLAVFSAAVIGALYVIAAFSEFLAPYTMAYRNIDYAFAPPQRLRFVDDKGIHLWPFVYGLNVRRDPETMRLHYSEDKDRRYAVKAFVHGEPYHLWGLFSCDVHLLGVDAGGTLFLLGADSLGRDMFSRIAYGARISLTIGLIGVTLSFLIGLLVGVISGYYGGWVDHFIQRSIEILRSFPAVPLWMALSAALPASWPPLRTYLGITVVLSFLGWTGLARQVRGKILALREEDFVTAALLTGAGQWRIMTRHLLPSFTSHIVVSLTLALPGMILGETALSFLGLGLRPPVTSWGVLLKEAQNVQAIASYPWLLTPALAVIVTVLAFNFVGDGLRDAADPYAQ